MAALEPRILLTVQAISPSTTLAFTERTGNSPSLGTFQSPDAPVANAINAQIEWGDGTVSPGTINVNPTGVDTFSVTGTHAYADETAAGAPLPITVVVTDTVDNTSATLVDAAAVADFDQLSARPQDVTATENVGFTNISVAQIVNNNELTPPTDFVATIDWGDGSQSAGQLTGSGGVFTLSGSHTYAEDGSDTVKSVVSDPGGTSVTTTSTAVVAEAALSATGVAVSAQEFTNFNAAVATFSHGDGSEPTTDFAAAINWGDGTTGTGTVTAANGTYTVSGSHNYAEDGAYPVSVAITDASSGSATVNTTATIAESPIAPTAAAVNGTELVALTAAVATFTHGNGSEPTTDFAAAINWGDGTTGTGTVTAANGTYTVSGSHSYAEDGTYAVSATITDTSSGSATVNTTATIAEAPIAPSGREVSGVEQTPLTPIVAAFTHGNGSEPTSDFAATIAWGDGTTSTGTISNSGVYAISGSHTYAEDGTYAISVTINDASGGSTTANSTATIAEAPLSAVGTTFTGQASSTLNETVATFSHGSGTEPAGDFRATINWGDGSSSPGEVSVSGGTYSVSGSHLYTAAGTFAVNVTIDDLSRGTTTASGVATIMAAATASSAVAVVAPEATMFAGPVATFTQGDGSEPASDFGATIDWGDGSSSTGTVASSNGTYVVSGSHLYAEDGTFPVTIIVNHIDNAPFTINTVATITEAPLVGSGLPVTGTETTNSTVVVATFSAGQEPVSSFTASIDWGEGVQTPGTVTLLASGQYQISGTYAYLDEGSYPIAVTVAESAEPSSSMVIRTTATISEGPPSVGGPGVEGTPAQDYVSQLYRDVLDRPVDRPSSQILVNLLLAGQPRLVITEPLADSPEHLRLVVAQAYQNFLGRLPDAAGLDFWTAALGRGLTDEQLAATMIAADEFFHAAGGDNRAWVDAMYLKLLGRTADSNGEAFWLNALNQGQSRFEVALAIATSPEHEGSIVSADYSQLLHRTGSPAEINAWVLQMQAGMSDEALLARIAASDEYFDRLSEVQ